MRLEWLKRLFRRAPLPITAAVTPEAPIYGAEPEFTPTPAPVAPTGSFEDVIRAMDDAVASIVVQRRAPLERTRVAPKSGRVMHYQLRIRSEDVVMDWVIHRFAKVVEQEHGPQEDYTDFSFTSRNTDLRAYFASFGLIPSGVNSTITGLKRLGLLKIDSKDGRLEWVSAVQPGRDRSAVEPNATGPRLFKISHAVEQAGHDGVTYSQFRGLVCKHLPGWEIKPVLDYFLNLAAPNPVRMLRIDGQIYNWAYVDTYTRPVQQPQQSARAT